MWLVNEDRTDSGHFPLASHLLCSRHVPRDRPQRILGGTHATRRAGWWHGGDRTGRVADAMLCRISGVLVTSGIPYARWVARSGAAPMGKQGGKCLKYCRALCGLAMTTPSNETPAGRSASHVGLSWLTCRRQKGQYKPRSIVRKTGPRRRNSARATVPSPSAAGRAKSGARSPRSSAARAKSVIQYLLRPDPK